MHLLAVVNPDNGKTWESVANIVEHQRRNRRVGAKRVIEALHYLIGRGIISEIYSGSRHGYKVNIPAVVLRLHEVWTQRKRN